jgi:hypothetical protein
MTVRLDGAIKHADRRSARAFFDALGLTYYERMKNAEVLDMFARDGQLTVDAAQYHQYGGVQLDLWELEDQHRESLEMFDPRDVKVGCSYKALAECRSKYDVVVVDTPQGVHSDFARQPRVEHFDVVRKLGPILKDQALVVLYVNKRPYDVRKFGEHGYDTYQEYDYEKWMAHRQQFYGSAIIGEGTALQAYKREFQMQGLSVVGVLLVPCKSDVEGVPDYAFRVALDLKRERS